MRPKKEAEKYGKVLTKAIVALAKSGKTNAEIARAIGISPKEFSLWVRSSSELKREMEDTRSFIEGLVEHSLLQLALGFKHKEVKVFCDKSGNITEHNVMKYYPPHFQAIQFLLKNLAPDKWKDRHEIAIDPPSGTVKNVTEAIEIMSNDPALLGGVHHGRNNGGLSKKSVREP
jgi:hypothetical protein